MDAFDTVAGVLLGTAVGDAVGLPHEGLHPRRIARRLRRGPLDHQLIGRRGMLSDDTEHASMVARALAQSRGDVDAFIRSLSGQLRRWFIALPPGVGFATLRACLRLLVGVPAHRSGVHSAGNGRAMRSALLGVCARDETHLVALVRASTRVTHTDRRAEDGALLVARLARQLSRRRLDAGIVDAIRDEAFRQRVRDAWGRCDAPLDAFRERAGFKDGVSGFIVHTTPAAVYCALGAPDARGGLERAIRLGGDTDTTAAIVGALVGARWGAGGLPSDWLAGVWDWPLTVDTLRALAAALTEDQPIPEQRWLAAIPRNLAFVSVIVGHLALRLFGR